MKQVRSVATQLGVALVLIPALCSAAIRTEEAIQPATLSAVRCTTGGHVNPNTGTRVCLQESATSEVVLARGKYTRNLNVTGWNDLELSILPDTSNDAATLSDLGFAAGMVEGALSITDIVTTMANGQAFYNSSLDEFRTTNDAYMKAQIAIGVASTAVTERAYWNVVAMSVGMFEGMAAIGTAEAGITKYMMWMQTAQGDLLDIMGALNIPEVSAKRPATALKAQSKKAPSPPRRAGAPMPLQSFQHCSALVKMNADMSDVYMGHATWGTYNQMNRIFKRYVFNFPAAAVADLHLPATPLVVSFSSYPGVPVSIDDFYVLSSGLAVTETSLTVTNMALYNGNVVPQSLLYWVRVIVANTLATSASQWTDLFGLRNSGTYNNQWMVLDYNKFSPTMTTVAGLLYIAEQVPGGYWVEDMSRELMLGYWPSYNIPFNTEFHNAMGYNCTGQGASCFQTNDYNRASRAQIFRRDQNAVHDLESMKHIMQYNQYKTDPASYGDPTNAVASRGDLLPADEGGACWGAVDAKITSWSMFRAGQKTKGTGQIAAFSGPTPQQGIFSFSAMPAGAAMCEWIGMPNTYNFTWVTYTS